MYFFEIEQFWPFLGWISCKKTANRDFVKILRFAVSVFLNFYCGSISVRFGLDTLAERLQILISINCINSLETNPLPYLKNQESEPNWNPNPISNPLKVRFDPDVHVKELPTCLSSICTKKFHEFRKWIPTDKATVVISYYGSLKLEKQNCVVHFLIYHIQYLRII